MRSFRFQDLARNNAHVTCASPRLLSRTGEEHAEVAKEMAYGVRLNLIGDIGLAVTGIAGPGGGSPEKPVGLTYVGISTLDVHEAFEFRWDGDREANKVSSARAAIQVLTCSRKGR